jgi:hypothetical protein
MALIFPSLIPADSPPGEREVYQRLKNDPETSRWIVLHSLDIANHISQLAGEADFVVIVPGKGVVCIEVKSHSVIRCTGGDWYYGKNTVPDPRGPFKQVATAMHSIRNHLIKIRPDFGRIVFWSVVVFPYAAGNVITGEWHPWQLIDRKLFSSAPLSKLILSVIDNARRILDSKQVGWFHPNSGEPYPEQVEDIAKILRPSFEFYESARSREKRVNNELKQYTEDQLAAIDHMESNARVIYTGPAGTGKTLIAMEAARRSYNIKRSTLFICYNNLLGKWLKEQTASLSEYVKTSTLHALMLDVAKQSPYINMEDNEFWEDKLPLMAMEGLVENADKAYQQFDELIVDEAQDVITDRYLDFLDLILCGGLASGRWRFFGDFEKQAIYRSNVLNLGKFLAGRGNNAPEYKLRDNCRNTPRVAAYAGHLGALSPYYRKVLRPDDGVEPTIKYYGNLDEQKKQVKAFIEEVLQDEYQYRDIVFLSHRNDSCAASLSLEDGWKDHLVPIDRRSGNRAGYCTIQAFKGLEAPVVIINDIEHVDTQHRTDMFYTGITRSLNRLAIFVSNAAKNDIKQLLI